MTATQKEIDLIEERLSPLALEIAEATSKAAAIALISALGGQRLYIPDESTLHDEHRLVAAVGWDDAILMTRIYARTTIEVPTQRALENHRRDRDILQRHFRGESPREIARQHNLAPNHVRYLLRNRLKEINQAQKERQNQHDNQDPR